VAQDKRNEEKFRSGKIYSEHTRAFLAHYMEREDMQYTREYKVLEVEINPELPDGLFVFSS